MSSTAVKIEYRAYQERVIEKTIQAIKDGHTNILIVSPTGSGKTIMGHEIARRLYEEFGWNYGWTCMRVNLVSQAKAENEDKFGLEYGVYFSSFMKNPPEDIDVLIEDEAQHSASETSTNLHNRIRPKVHIALTATPYRTDRMKLCYSKVIQDAGLRQLVDEGWLAPYDLYITNMKWEPRNVADVYLRDPERWGKSLMFFLTRAKCWECCEILREAGVRCDVVEGGDPRSQERKIQQFHDGELDVLINVFVLTEGFDAPELKSVFVRPGSKGPTVQMAGRAFRKFPDYTHKNVIQNTESLWPFTQIVSPRDKLVWDEEKEEWQSRAAEQALMLRMQIRAMQTLRKAPEAKLPKWLIEQNRKHNKKRRWNRSGHTNEDGTLDHGRATDREIETHAAGYEDGDRYQPEDIRFTQ